MTPASTSTSAPELALDRAQRVRALARGPRASRSLISVEYRACSRKTSVFRRSMSGVGKSSMSWKTGLSIGACRAPLAARSTSAARSPAGSAGLPPASSLYGSTRSGARSNGVPRDVGADEHRRVRPHRVAHAELVEDVRVGGREVGDRVVGEDQPLEHRLVDEPADDLLVGAQRLELGVADRRRDQLLVDGVEVDRAALAVGLLAERHDDEAQRRSPASDDLRRVGL